MVKLIFFKGMKEYQIRCYIAKKIKILLKYMWNSHTTIIVIICLLPNLLRKGWQLKTCEHAIDIAFGPWHTRSIKLN